MSETDTSTEAIAEMSRKLRSQDPADLPWRMEVADTHDALAAERDALHAENRLMAKSLDAEELRVGLSTTGGMWRFWRDKAADVVSENAALRAEVERLRYVLEGVRGAIDTGRNEPLQIWRDQIEIALQASSALKGAANG